MITVYTKTNCPQCSATKRQFDKAGVAYEEINLENNPEILSQLKAQGWTSAPIIEAKLPGLELSWCGFDLNNIKTVSHAVHNSHTIADKSHRTMSELVQKITPAIIKELDKRPDSLQIPVRDFEGWVQTEAITTWGKEYRDAALHAISNMVLKKISATHDITFNDSRRFGRMLRSKRKTESNRTAPIIDKIVAQTKPNNTGEFPSTDRRITR